MNALNTPPTIQTNAVYAPENFGDIVCLGWTVVDLEENVIMADANTVVHTNLDWGILKEKGAKIEAIVRALDWAGKEGYRNATILTDDLRVATEVAGLEEPPKRCKSAYREVLQTAQEKLAQSGGYVGWAHASGKAAHDYCQDYFMQQIRAELARRMGGTEDPLTGDEGGEIDPSKESEAIEVIEETQTAL